jgi:hypothetical protein
VSVTEILFWPSSGRAQTTFMVTASVPESNSTMFRWPLPTSDIFDSSQCVWVSKDNGCKTVYWVSCNTVRKERGNKFKFILFTNIIIMDLSMNQPSSFT